MNNTSVTQYEICMFFTSSGRISFKKKQKTVFDNIIRKYRSRRGVILRVKHLLLPIRLSILFVWLFFNLSIYLLYLASLLHCSSLKITLSCYMYDVFISCSFYLFWYVLYLSLNRVLRLNKGIVCGKYDFISFDSHDASSKV